VDGRSDLMRGASEGFRQRAWAGAWVALLLAILGFLVIYPLLVLLVGALTDTNPVVEGISLSRLSVANFLTVLANPNVAEALFNTLLVCGGGTLIAVVIGLLSPGSSCAPTRRSRVSLRPPASCRCSRRRWSPASRGRSWARRRPG
jgi:ABC-type spermidine/putrescine transport system permease subunit II